MFTDRIRFVFLRMLDREGLLDVIPYNITLHQVYSELGYATFGSEPCCLNDYNTIYTKLINSFKKQKEKLINQKEESFKRVNYNILGRDFTPDEKEHLKEILTEKYEQLSKYIDKQQNIATNIFFGDFKSFIYDEYARENNGKKPEDKEKGKILEKLSQSPFEYSQDFIKRLRIKFFDLDWGKGNAIMQEYLRLNLLKKFKKQKKDSM